MYYLGGKFRIRKQISSKINELIKQNNIDTYIEPFCGSCWITYLVKCKNRYASDICEPLITLFVNLQNGWVPPDLVDEELYKKYKNNPDPKDPLTAFIGFGCSYAGKWFGGYARSGKRNFALAAKRSILRKMKGLKDVVFECKSYESISAKNCLIYCDPPYDQTTTFDFDPGFNTEMFWQKCREWSKDNIVLISEYKAPDDFECISSMETRTAMHTKRGKDKRTEKLFKYSLKNE